jgi:hypothetical protein
MSENKPTDRTTNVASQPEHDDIANLAYALWERRGGGDGGAEQDWLEAERMLASASTPATKAQAA